MISAAAPLSLVTESPLLKMKIVQAQATLTEHSLVLIGGVAWCYARSQ